MNDCVFCATATKRALRQFPEREEVLAFIERCGLTGVANLVFSGLGEPTLDPSFEDYLSQARAHPFRSVCLFTNGFGLTEEKARRWKALGVTDVLLSMHGMQPGHDRSVRRAGSFQEAARALDMYCAGGYRVSVNTCLTRFNLDEIPSLREYLAPFRLELQTLSFPEWDGNAPACEDVLPDYEEVAARANLMIPINDRTTWFDNVPYCLVQRKIRELRGVSAVEYLDGRGPSQLSPHGQKEYPERCRRDPCPLSVVCPGFDPVYLAVRGWRKIPARVDAFLDALARGERAVLASSARASEDHAQRAGAHTATVRERRLTVILKPTGRCNGACTYCSSFGSAAGRDMDLGLVETIHAEVLDHAERARFGSVELLWHGGEPLLMGRDFFARAWGLARDQRRLPVRQLVQTNLLAVDAAWIDLLRTFEVAVSTSVDPFGDARRHADGTPQFAAWMEAFLSVVDSNVPLGLVFTVTPSHLDRADEVYAFLANLQLLARRPMPVKVNPVHPSGRAAIGTGRSCVPALRAYGAFLARLWELWDSGGKPFPLAPIDAWASGRYTQCEFSGCCDGAFVAVDGRADVYRCGRFLDDRRGALGNLRERGLHDLVEGAKGLAGRAAALEAGACRGCGFWTACRGGCPYIAELLLGDPHRPSPQCESVKAFFAGTGLPVVASGGTSRAPVCE